jgi:hypothetical protein
MKASSWLLAALMAACGGKAVIDERGGGGNATTSTGSAGAGPTSTTTGAGRCLSHDDCAPGLCIFTTGACAPACTIEDPCDGCGPGLTCEACATSSCPDCRDCRPACVAKTDGRCDADDPCPGAFVCSFAERVCYPPCGPGGECGEFAYCEECLTGSCCACLDCVAACVGGR